MARVNPEKWGLDRLTDREKIAHTMRREGQTYQQIGEALKIGLVQSKKLVERAVKNGLPPPPRKQRYGQKGEHIYPAVAAEAMVGAVAENVSQQFNQVAFLKLCEDQGVPRKMAEAMGRRVAANFKAVREGLRSLKNDEMIAKLEEKTALLLEYVDEAAIANASLKDIAIAFGILTEKKLLLGGKPTQIIDVSTSSRLEILMPQFMAEAVRRGITLDVVPTGKLVEDAAA